MSKVRVRVTQVLSVTRVIEFDVDIAAYHVDGTPEADKKNCAVEAVRSGDVDIPDYDDSGWRQYVNDTPEISETVEVVADAK